MTTTQPAQHQTVEMPSSSIDIAATAASKPDSTKKTDAAAAAEKSLNYPYSCEIDVTFPTAMHAQQAMQVMQVDKEIGDRATKSFSLCSTCSSAEDVNGDNDKKEDDLRVLRIRFQAVEAKILRVSVSSFYDYLTVALKCYQEFDSSL